MKGGEAETYHNVEIKYIPGRKAILTIFHDGEEHEKIELSGLKQREEMHAMFLEKGFVKKSDEELEAIRLQLEREVQEESDLKNAKRLVKQSAEYEKSTAEQIRELEAERDETNDPDKKRNLATALDNKSQQLQWQRGVTKERFENIKQIEARKKQREKDAREEKELKEIKRLEKQSIQKKLQPVHSEL